MTRLRAITVLLLLAALGLGSCHSSEWWANDLAGHGRALNRDMDQIHRQFDKYFLNYDWNDPYLD